MLLLITYDVKTQDKVGQKRLRHIAKICEDFGQRVQFSVFECKVDPGQWVSLRQQLLDTFDPDHDSLRFYFLGANWHSRIEHHGSKPGFDPDGLLLV
jgi:CRISPR-associated protein Cas2